MKIDEQLINKIGIIVFLILISCSKDEVKPNVPNNPSNPPVVEDQSTQQSCLLKTFDSETLSYVILRNDLGLPTKINFIKYRGEDIDYSATFEYDDSQRLIKLENERSFSTYSYDNLGRMVLERLEAYSNPEIYAERSFIYNEDGYLDSAYHSPDDYERFVYDDHGNVTKRFVKNRGQAEFLVQEYLEFDDKKNPFYEFSFFSSIILVQSGLIGITVAFNPVRHKTNVLHSKLYNANGTIDAFSVTYSYSNSGYPISSDKSIYGYQCE